jgi:S1-C subfamily serine protease
VDSGLILRSDFVPGAIVWKFPVYIRLAILIGWLGSSSTSHADEFSACLRANSTSEKIELCSLVIRHSRRTRQLERAYLRRGNAYAEANRFADAVDDFNSLIRLNPTVAGYYDNRQYALKSMGRLREALDDANMAIRLAPTYSFGYRSRGIVNDAMGRHDIAIADYTKAISIEPRDAGLLIDQGKILAKVGRDREAIADFSHALDIDDKAVAAFRERGLVYKKLGDIAAALADLTWFTRFEPQDQEVIRAIEEMQAAALPPRQAQPPPSHPPEAKRAERENSKPSEGQRSGSSGTGFVVSTDGYVVTNAHVVDGCSNPQLISGLASPVLARVLATDTANDLALLKGDLMPNRAASLRVGVKIGEEIATFGYPLVGLLSTSGNFTVGNVSAITGLGDDTRYLQISAPVQPGNSGGPVLDQSGNVVGIVVSKLDAIKVAAAINDVAQNVNFAIKTTVLTNFLDASGVSYTTACAGQSLQPSDLAERAKSISAQIQCEK